MESLYDVTIIGGGPAGLYAAFQASFSGLKTQLLEAAPYFGGKLTTYSERIIHDIGGVPSVTGSDLIQQLVEQAKIFHPDLRLAEQVTDVQLNVNSQDYLIQTNKTSYRSNSLILAMGNGIIRPKKLAIFGEDHFANLATQLAPRESYRGESVTLLGNATNVLALADYLAVAERVDLISPQPLFKDKGESQVYLEQHQNVRYYEQRIVDYTVTKPNLTGVILADKTHLPINYLSGLPTKSKYPFELAGYGASY